jgi:hypothetical protein
MVRLFERRRGRARLARAIALDVKLGALFVNPQKAEAALPAPQDDQARVVFGFIDRAVHMTDHDQIDRASAPDGIIAKDTQVALFLGDESALIAPDQGLIEHPGDRPGDAAEPFVEWPAFHPGFPNPPRAQEMAVDKPQPKTVDREIMWLGDDPCPQLALVKRAEPRVVIARHDRQRASLAPELGQGPKALAAQQIDLPSPRSHPEVAEVTDDEEVVVTGQSAQPRAEAPVAIGTIESQVNIAREVMRHGPGILARL